MKYAARVDRNQPEIGLCPDHHRGPHGIHGDKQILRQLKCSEMDLLAYVISRTQA